MDNILLAVIQVILAFLVVGGILLQRSDAALGGALTGGGDGPTTRFTRRGAELQMFKLTFAVSVVFVFSVLIGFLF